MSDFDRYFPEAHSHQYAYGYANGELIRHCPCGAVDRQVRLFGWLWKVWREV